MTAFKCLDCAKINISKYDGKRCGECGGPLVPFDDCCMLDEKIERKPKLKNVRIFENNEIRERLDRAFPRYFVNHNYEIIIYPPQNSYFRLEDVYTELELKAKILEWLSREAAKSISDKSQKYHLEGINTFLETSFTKTEMMDIYSYLGNRCNHQKTLDFINSGYDMKVLLRASVPEVLK